jgi:hypothetical protein
MRFITTNWFATILMHSFFISQNFFPVCIIDLQPVIVIWDVKDRVERDLGNTGFRKTVLSKKGLVNMDCSFRPLVSIRHSASYDLTIFSFTEFFRALSHQRS